MICSFCLAAIEHGTMFYAPKGSPRHLRREIPACNDCWRDAHDKLLAQGYLVGDVINMKVVSTREEANVKAFAALGKATTGYHWVIKWGSIKECPHLEGTDAQPST